MMTERAGAVLVVEDDALLALDLADLLADAGYRVCDPAGNNETARRAIEREKPRFALLDYNLGGETSVPTAIELVRRNIPFVYVTGRADAVKSNPLAPAAPILSKPYRVSEILAAISRIAA